MKFTVKKRNTPTLLIPCSWNDCKAEFHNDWELNNHIERMHLLQYLPNPDECCSCLWDDCKFETKDIQEFQRHVFYHGYYNGLLVHGKYEFEKNEKVPECSAPAKEGKNKIPDLKADFRCEWTNCCRTFASIVEFQDHIVQHASFDYEVQKSPNNKRPKIKCNWNCCKKKLMSKYRLIEHIQTHSNKKQLACYHCGELFRTKTTLFDHLRRQQNNSTDKFQCARCFKFFASEKLLRSHVVKHVNCYKCSLCDMTCSSSSSLTTHIRYRHLKDKPFKCSECEYRCVRTSDLSKHVKLVHNKEVHHCDHPGCNYAVRTYYTLRRHYLDVHENNPYIYICHCCEKIFKNGKSLSAHLIKKHDFQLPSGHKRFTYRVDESGYYRPEIMRIESLEVTKQILSPNPLEVSEVTQDSSCYEIISMTNENDARIIVSNDTNEAARLVGEVVISLPNLHNDYIDF